MPCEAHTHGNIHANLLIALSQHLCGTQMHTTSQHQGLCGDNLSTLLSIQQYSTGVVLHVLFVYITGDSCPLEVNMLPTGPVMPSSTASIVQM